jgi:hypothetical protein
MCCLLQDGGRNKCATVKDESSVICFIGGIFNDAVQYRVYVSWVRRMSGE